MKELSIFVDESGDFGAYSKHSPYYLFSLVFHEQDKSIDGIVDELDRKVVEHGFPVHAIHTGPIIRNEGYYRRFSIADRKKLFNDILFFAKKADISYHIISADKRKHSKISLVDDLSKQLISFIKDNLEYFLQFDKIIIYYDYGQSEITTILTSVFNSFITNLEFRHVRPYQYKLFQVADLLCTLELAKIKFDNNQISESELKFYGSRRKFRDFYYKSVKGKKI